jgi:hypothetical protein
MDNCEIQSSRDRRINRSPRFGAHVAEGTGGQGGFKALLR